MTTTKKEHRLLEALAEIRESANSAIGSDRMQSSDSQVPDGSTDESSSHDLSCTIKVLPSRLLIDAAKTAVKANPANAPGPMIHRAMESVSDVDRPLRMALSTAKYWGPMPRQLTVSFMESTPADLAARILEHMNAWTKSGCISFVATNGTGQVRISRGPGGYFSYLGTDILHIPSDRQTMNLEGFTMKTPASEYKRVVRHETGHTLGAQHEHMRRALIAKIDRQKAYDYFWRTQHWNQQMVDAQVLTPLHEQSLLSTPPDQDSIMCYQLPGSITLDGEPIRGGTDINPTDYAFIGRVYPKATGHHAAICAIYARPVGDADDWPESDDVQVSV